MYLIIANIGLILTTVALGYLIYSVIKKNGNTKKAGIATLVGVALFFVGGSMDDTPAEDKTIDVNDSNKDNQDDEIEDVVDEEADEIEDVVDEEADEIEDVVDEDEYVDIKENIIGKSNKDIMDLGNINPKDVRNDKTGNWKMATIANSFDMKEYAISYSKEYINDKEIHYIVNFNNNTTSQMSKANGLLFLTITEYEKKEEHDAEKIGGGMVLGDYIIYPDGDIEDIKE